MQKPFKIKIVAILNDKLIASRVFFSLSFFAMYVSLAELHKSSA